MCEGRAKGPRCDHLPPRATRMPLPNQYLFADRGRGVKLWQVGGAGERVVGVERERRREREHRRAVCVWEGVGVGAGVGVRTRRVGGAGFLTMSAAAAIARFDEKKPQRRRRPPITPITHNALVAASPRWMCDMVKSSIDLTRMCHLPAWTAVPLTVVLLARSHTVST